MLKYWVNIILISIGFKTENHNEIKIWHYPFPIFYL